MGFTLPRYFVGRTDLQDANENPGASTPLHIIDSFFIGNRHLEEREWVVTVDEMGVLRALPREHRGALSELLQNELAFNEISHQRPSRLIEAMNVFLFNLQLVEQVGGAAPGLNDPVYLYGTLYEIDEPGAGGVKGQLTVTRGDLLAALVMGADHAFRYNEAVGDGFSRCFQLMLPGDTEGEISRGSGIILAYPLFPAELLATGAANEIIISQLIYDLLGSLREDMKRERSAHPLLSMLLPVPNRFDLEQELESKGYTIEGDTAVKKNISASGFKGLLASVFGSLMKDELTLPREGKVEDFLALARQTLISLQQDFLTSRVVALRNCLKTAPAGGSRPAYAPVPPVKVTPQSSAPIPPRVRLPRRKTDDSGSQPPDWMKDFMTAHRSDDSRSKITSTLKMKPPIISAAKTESEGEKQNEWLKDFAPRPSQKPDNDNKKDQPTGETDWMKDFE